MKSEREQVFIANLFGALQEPAFQCLTLYLPDKDRDGKPIEDHGKWIKEARELLSKIGGGATALRLVYSHPLSCETAHEQHTGRWALPCRTYSTIGRLK